MRKDPPVKSLVASLTEIKRADTDYLIARKYYRGDRVAEHFSNPNLAVLFKASAEHYHVNIAKRPVDAVLDRLEVSAITVTRGDAPDEALAAVLEDKIRRPNRLDQTLEDLFEMAEEYGDAYLMTWPSSRVDDELRVTAYSPVGMRMFYDDEEPTLATHALRTWLVPPPDGSPAAGDAEARKDPTKQYRRVNVYTAGYIQKLISTKPAAEVQSDDDFVPYTADDPEPDPESTEPQSEPGAVDNPDGRIPIFHFRTKRPYGEPEHYSVYGCQNLLVKEIVTLAEATDGFGLPFRFALKESAQALGSASDVFDTDTSGERTQRGKVDAKPGGFAQLWDVKEVGQLTPADVKNLLEPIDKIMALASTVSTTPLDYFDPSAAAASGVSKKEHKDPLFRKVGRRQRDFGAELADALELGFEQLGYPGVTVTVDWKPIQELDAAAAFATTKEGQDAGFSFEESAKLSGFAGTEVDEARGWRNRGAELEHLAMFAEALQKMGAAAQMLPGMVTPELIRSAVETLIPVAEDEGTGGNG